MGKTPLNCPAVKCGKTINEVDLSSLLSEEQFEKYQKFAIKNAMELQQDISWCPNPHCDFAFFYEEKGDSIFKCPVCDLKFCLDCRVDYHRGQTCKEFQRSNKRDQNDIAFEEFAIGNKLKQCPFCSHWVQKSKGC